MLDCFGSFNKDLKMLNEKDVMAMVSECFFGGCTQNNVHINFGIHRTKSIKATIHWVQDFYCISEKPKFLS
jgi:hypothetical protein